MHAKIRFRTENNRFVLLLVFLRARQKGDSKREKPDPERTFSQSFADFCRFSLIFGSLCKSRDLGVADVRRKPQETADFRSKPQKTADFCRNGFLPFAVSLLARSYFRPQQQHKKKVFRIVVVGSEVYFGV